MHIFGDPWRNIDLRRWRDRAAAPLQGRWIERHAEIADRLIEAGQILQALEDEAFSVGGTRDREQAHLVPLKRHLLALARALAASLDHQATPAALDLPRLPEGLPDTLVAREPEGYAFYALYPEAYGLAARPMTARPLGARSDALVIGLRSIGASLAPMAAAQVGAAHFTTLRPKGHPFAREIDAPDLQAALAVGPARDVLIVDEGPGLSGSSFASVARFVRAAAPQSRVVFLPSHAGGPGPQASAETRAMFDAIPRLVAPFADTLPARLPGWVADLTGPASAPLENLSGGEWRRRLFASESQWPAVDPMQERLKVLMRTERGAFLLKFVGLGDIGARKARLAQAMGAAGLAPETLGLRHGFLVTRWLDDAHPLQSAHDRTRLLPALARYLAFRQQRFPCPNAFGASPRDLRAMVARNVSLALDESAADRAVRRMGPLTDHASHLRPVATDNRMSPHEWLATADGRILKTDGIDHHAGHDLIGAQDIAYDVAAASVEFDLTPAQTAALCRGLANETGHSVAPAVVDGFRIVWLAFETGRITLARNGCAATPEEHRLRSREAALTDRLRRELA